MNRRIFTQALATSAVAAPQATPQATDKRINVALLTHAAGPHLAAYLEGLAKADEVSAVYLSDPDEQVKSAASEALGAKLAASFRSPDELFARHKPAMALVTMEARVAPPAIRAALSAGCHVLAEKPACTKLADFEALAREARRVKRSL